MSMQAPSTDPELHEYKQKLKEQQIKWTVGVVWPDGRVTEHVCPPPAKKGSPNGETEGFVVVQWIEQKPRIRAEFENKGLRMLEDVCRADGVPQLYQVWKDTVRARIEGYRIQATSEQIYPPTVLELRKRHASGDHVSGKVFIPGKGLVDADEVDEADRLADKLESAGLGRPSPADRKGRKAAKEKDDVGSELE